MLFLHQIYKLLGLVLRLIYSDDIRNVKFNRKNQREMKRKSIGGLLFLVVALMTMFAMPSYAAKKKGVDGKAKIAFAQTSHQFGNIMETKPVTCEFEFENGGSGNLVIIDATAECGCTRPEYPKNPIAPGKKGKIKVTYNPLGRPGSFDKVVTVKTNGEPRKVRLHIRGAVIPKGK